MVYILGFSKLSPFFQLESVFTESATTTFKQYSNSTDTSFRDAWDSFQKSVSVSEHCQSICLQGLVALESYLSRSISMLFGCLF